MTNLWWNRKSLQLDAPSSVDSVTLPIWQMSGFLHLVLVIFFVFLVAAMLVKFSLVIPLLLTQELAR